MTSYAMSRQGLLKYIPTLSHSSGIRFRSASRDCFSSLAFKVRRFAKESLPAEPQAWQPQLQIQLVNTQFSSPYNSTTTCSPPSILSLPLPPIFCYDIIHLKMVQYVITPWRNRAELLQVRQKLYPGAGREVKEEERRHAVARVSVWMQRGNCPHLVESTAILTAAVLNDVSGNSTYCVRAAYAAAFCRFVTGLMDSHQDKRRKLSMYSIAKTIGLPATYVELRHQATHEELPSLSKLRTATQKALRWIWEYYWVHLTAENSVESNCKAFLSKLVEEKNEQARWNMEKTLSNWDEDQLLDALIEIQGETDETQILLRALQIHRSIVNGTIRDGENKEMPSQDMQDMEIVSVRDEMSRMEAELNKKEDVEFGLNDSEMIVDIDSGAKGWSKWARPWTPKPIGVV